MNKKVLILGASGNFGSKIAKLLAKSNIELILSGRRKDSLTHLKNDLLKAYPDALININSFDIHQNIRQHLESINPFLVINTCGPFQTADYSLATCCIDLGIHYIDLADGREFVNGIHDALNDLAKSKNCLVVSGASTVPCLSSAVLDHFKNQFSEITSLKYGITPGQKTERGLATTQAILSYIGKPLKSIPGDSKKRYGWQDLYRQTYPVLGKRWMANCDIPDYDLFPKYYGIQDIQFSAGLESHCLHLSLWLLSWLVRLHFSFHLEKQASLLLKLSHLFDSFGSANGGMHIIISGKDHSGNSKTITWFIIAKNNEGPFIPTIPSVILAKKLVAGSLNLTGALPCMNLISLEEYLKELDQNKIQIYTQ